MDEISSKAYAAKAKQFIMKDVKHSIIIGIGAFVVIASIGILPNNRSMLPGLIIAAFFLLLIMLLKALVDWKRSFYLIEINDFSLVAKPYTRISGTYDYYFSIISVTNIYSITLSGNFKKSHEDFTKVSCDVVTPFYEELVGKKQKIVVLFSHTKTLLGCFDITDNFIANS